MEDLIKRALQVRDKYKKLNQKNGTEWYGEDYMAGFVGDVGDLSKLIMAKRGLRGDTDDNTINDKLAHELSDCLWSVCVLADMYGIDLEQEFYKNMNDLDNGLSKLLN